MKAILIRLENDETREDLQKIIFCKNLETLRFRKSSKPYKKVSSLSSFMCIWEEFFDVPPHQI